MRSATLVALCALAGCRTSLDLDPAYNADGGVAADLAMADLAGADLAPTVDEGCPPPVDAGACPCGSQGLCRPATGRIAVQTQSANGQLRLVVMDDNGCNRHDVGSDQPVGVARFAPDGERLAYITAGGSSTLHVIRVVAAGNVVCRDQAFLGGLRAQEVIWQSNDEVWLFAPGATQTGPAAIARFKLGGGQDAFEPLTASRVDAIGDGPLAVVEENCGTGCASRIAVRPQVLGAGPLTEIARDAQVRFGAVRLSRDGAELAWEVPGGFDLSPVAQPQVAPYMLPGARSPVFHGTSSVFVATDDGRLLDVPIGDCGSSCAPVEIPSTWVAVYAPDWSPPPASCMPSTTCF